MMKTLGTKRHCRPLTSSVWRKKKKKTLLTFLKNTFFYVLQMKLSHTGFEQHKDE